MVGWLRIRILLIWVFHLILDSARERGSHGSYSAPNLGFFLGGGTEGTDWPVILTLCLSHPGLHMSRVGQG